LAYIGLEQEMKMPEPQTDGPRRLEAFRIWHQRQPQVWEVIEGVPKLMAPGSKAHTPIKGSAHAALAQALCGTGCHALVDGAIVELHGSSLIPDLVVACAPLDSSTPRVEKAPIVVEILSRLNRYDDMNRKLSLHLESRSPIQDLVIDQDRRQVVHHRRPDEFGGPFPTNIAAAAPLRLEPPGLEPPLAATSAGGPLE
jgi:Uma2 family endonuclease